MDEYYRLDELYHDAYDRVQSGGTGAGYSGIHYEVMNELRSMVLLLTDYEKTELGFSSKQSDEDYLNKFDDM